MKHPKISFPRREPLKPPVEWRTYQRRWISDPSRLTLGVKGAQLGFSFATASWAVGECVEQPGHLVVFISRSERQAGELGRKAKAVIDHYRLQAQLSDGFFRETEMLEHTIKFPNGSRIIALSSNPETARGYTGDIVLDEFGFHPDSEAVFSAAYRQITLGHKMRVLSTPNGQQGKFWELAKQCGVADGVEPESLKRSRLSSPIPPAVNGWSAHWCDIFRAKEDGFPIDPETVKSGCDSLTWQQEYLCVFLSGDLLWIPPALLEPAISIECPMGPPFSDGPFYAGWDIARNRDLSIIWFLQAAGELRNTAGVVELSGMPTPEQIEAARAWMPTIERLTVDSTGMGLTIFETLHKEFPDKVEAMQFTSASKEKMAVGMRTALEKHLLRVPDAQVVRRSFGSIRRAFTTTGQARFDAEHDAVSHHGDHFWAACMALASAEQPSVGLFEYYRREAEREREAQAKRPRSIARPAETPSAVSTGDREEWTRQEFSRILHRSR